MSRPKPLGEFCSRAKEVMEVMGLNARPPGTCRARTIKLAQGKGAINRKLAAVHCTLPLGHPPPHKNGDWELPTALLAPLVEQTRSPK